MLRWYVINTYSGHEKKVQANIERRIVTMGRQSSIRRIIIPTEQVVETNKDGQKIQTERRSTAPGSRRWNARALPRCRSISQLVTAGG